MARRRYVSKRRSPGTWSRTALATRSQVVSYLAAGRRPNRAQKSSMPQCGWPISSMSKRCTTRAWPSSDTSVLAAGVTRATTCMHRCSFSAAKGSCALLPLMMWRRVMRLALRCGATLGAVASSPSCCASRNLGSTPDTPLVACSRTRAAKAASELSPFKRAATSMGLASAPRSAPEAATCNRPTILRPMTLSRANGLAPTCGPNCSCSTCSK